MELCKSAEICIYLEQFFKSDHHDYLLANIGSDTADTARSRVLLAKVGLGTVGTTENEPPKFGRSLTF